MHLWTRATCLEAHSSSSIMEIIWVCKMIHNMSRFQRSNTRCLALMDSTETFQAQCSIKEIFHHNIKLMLQDKAIINIRWLISIHLWDNQLGISIASNMVSKWWWVLMVNRCSKCRRLTKDWPNSSRIIYNSSSRRLCNRATIL